MNIKNICVIGLGYIGLPTAALLANRGFNVYGVDLSKHVIDTINQGKIHIVEPELDVFVQSAVNSGKLVADFVPRHADVFMIAVPTPFHEGYVPNIDYVISATKSIAPFLKSGNVVILESTSPIGTTDKIEETLRQLGIATEDIHIAHCPERVLPGKVMKELIENDRIVGGVTPEATRVVKEFYETFVSGAVLATTAKTAEMCKLTENSYRDTNIAFANELSMICDKADIDVRELISLANKHPRVNILQPGAGVGGHCIAVDPWFIVADFPEEAKIIKQARLTNDYKSQWVFEKVKNSALTFEIENKRKANIACLGLAFKPDIDDLRESPALEIVRALKHEGLCLLIVEPNVEQMEEFELVLLDKALEKADLVVVLVAHKSFITGNLNMNGAQVLNFVF